jgi:hypothetical protein
MFLAALIFAVHPIGALLLTLFVIVGLKLAKFAGGLFVGGMTLAKWLLAIITSLAPLFGTTVAFPGYGGHLANGGVAGSSYTNLLQLKKFGFGGLKADFDDITNLDSPTIFKEWMKTVVDGSDVTFQGVMNPADPTLEGLLSNLATAGSAALNYWKITTTDGSVLIFQAYVADFKFDVEYNKAMVFSGSLKIVGNVAATWS